MKTITYEDAVRNIADNELYVQEFGGATEFKTTREVEAELRGQRIIVGQLFGVSFEKLDHDVQIARMTESLLTDKRQEFWAVFKAAFADGRRPSDDELDALIVMRWELDD